MTTAVLERREDYLATDPVRRRVSTSALPESALAEQLEMQINEIWAGILAKLGSLEDLGDSWDGLGARAPAPELLRPAAGLADLLRERGWVPPSAVAPAVDGGVSLEWQGADDFFIEVEIDRPFHAEVMVILL